MASKLVDVSKDAQRRQGRFPVDDGLGMYCWFCADVLHVEDAKPTGRPFGEGRFRVNCRACNHDTHFDRVEDD